jgi:hypothetical protein
MRGSRTRASHLCLVLAVTVAACSEDAPAVAQASQEILSAPALSTLVTGVGVTPEGSLAVRFNGVWFSLHATATTPWEVGNAVAATEIGAVPVDTSVTTPDCVCVPAEGGGCTRQEQIEQCGLIITSTTDETRTYSLTVGPSQYQVKAFQTKHTERALVATTGLRLGFAADMRFEINVVTPGQPGIGDARWVIAAKPRLSFISCQFDDATLEGINAEAEISTGLTTSDCDAAYSTAVQFAYARTESLPGAIEMRAPANDATDEALRQVLPSGTPYVSDTEPEAWDVRGNVLGRVADGTFGEISDLDRVSRFFLKGHDIGEYSNPATERPLISSAFPRIPDGIGIFPTNGQSWSYSHTIRDLHAQFPILGGICGVEAFLKASISGSVDYGTQSCFDGWVQSLTQQGRLAFDATAGAGGYCNIIVASASAGLSAGVTTAVEFSSHVDTLPPALVGNVTEYAELRFSAYFQTRILFWSKRWEKPFVARRVWQRGYEHRVLEQVSASQLCDPGKINVRDMFVPPTPTYLLPGNPLPFPPPIPNGVTAQLEVVVPAYPFALVGLKIQSSTGAEFPPAFTAIGAHPLGTLYRATFASQLLGDTGTLQRARFFRDETVAGAQFRHLSNWIDVPRVGP